MKYVRWLSLSFVVLLLIVPFLIPVNTSGTLTNEQAAERLWGGVPKFVEVAGHEVHFVEAGDPGSGRLILLLHGFGASAHSYKDNLEILGEVGHVIAYDRAAFGFTERPTEWDLNPYGTPGQIQVLDELIGLFGQGKDVYVLGHSAGGSIAASYAVEHQEKLAGLVLFAPAVLSGGGGPSGINWIYDIPQLDHLGPLLVSTIATSGLDILYASYFDESAVTDETLDGYTAPLEVIGWERAFWEFNKAPRDRTIGERLAEIDIPTLVITGDTDEVVATEDSKQVAQIMGAELVVIPQTGHLPNEEKPTEFANAVAEFLLGLGS
jgi:pimeloyl-ACP methyl ester carboxylesterase